MTGHVPFDAKSDWANPYCDNSSNDPLVDKMLGNAYHVVRTVYCNLGNLKLIYDFLNQYGMVLGVQSEEELKTLTTSATFARLYDKTLAGDRQVTEYLYVEGDRTGILPHDVNATGSWVLVTIPNSDGGNPTEQSGGYTPWVYNGGSAIGGETVITVPEQTIGVPFVVINGYTQTNGNSFSFDRVSLKLTLTQPLDFGDEVVLLLTGVPAVPNNPNIDSWMQLNWLYNNGAAMGGEQLLVIPYTFQDITAIYKNGLRLYKGLADESYSIDVNSQRLILTEPLVTNDRLIVQLGGEVVAFVTPDRTIEEVARAANVTVNNVILSSNTTQPLNGKTILYDLAVEKSYGIPTVPPNVYILSVSNGVLTYSPGGITVNLIKLTDFGALTEDSNGIIVEAVNDVAIQFKTDGVIRTKIKPAAVTLSAFTPGNDNLTPLGDTINRWSTVYAGTGAINTSDAREKTVPLGISDKVLDAWGSVNIIVYKWLTSVESKGDKDARYHFGAISQQVRDAFISHGLDGTEYGLLCYDEWPDEFVITPAVIDTVPAVYTVPVNEEDKPALLKESYAIVISPEKRVQTQVAGNRWGLRHDQCSWLEAAYQRREVSKLLKRVEALEELLKN